LGILFKPCLSDKSG